jgi:hypothetical protein
MQKLHRRDVLRGTGVAALAAGVAAVPFEAKAKAGGGELAALVRRYFAEVETFNATDHKTDREFDAHADATYNATLEQMVGVPVRTKGDALAVVDWLIKEGSDLSCEFDDSVQDDDMLFIRLTTSLVIGLREYLASTEVRS